MFDKADTDYDKNITVDEFTHTFIEAEKKLVEKIDIFESKRDDSFVRKLIQRM